MNGDTLEKLQTTKDPQTVKYSILNEAVNLGLPQIRTRSRRANISNSLFIPFVVSSPISLKGIHLFEEYSQNVTLGNVNKTL